jgi:hypothetical protein
MKKNTSRTSLLIGCGFRELVEDVEVSFVLDLTDHAALLEQVVRDLGTYWLALRVEHNL